MIRAAPVVEMQCALCACCDVLPMAAPWTAGVHIFPPQDRWKRMFTKLRFGLSVITTTTVQWSSQSVDSLKMFPKWY